MRKINLVWLAPSMVIWALLAVGGILAACSFVFFDLRIYNALPMLDPIIKEWAHKTTHLGKGDYWFILGILIAIIAIFYHRLRFLAYHFWLSMVGASLIVTLMKYTIGRVRPYMVHEYGIDHNTLKASFFESGFASFPSGHGMTLGVIWMVIFSVNRVVAMIVLPVIFWLVATRVLIYSHYLSDVLGGFTIGICWTMWMVGYAEYFKDNHKQKGAYHGT